MTVTGDGVPKPPTSERGTGVPLMITTSEGDAGGRAEVGDVQPAAATNVTIVSAMPSEPRRSIPSTCRTPTSV